MSDKQASRLPSGVGSGFDGRILFGFSLIADGSRDELT